MKMCHIYMPRRYQVWHVVAIGRHHVKKSKHGSEIQWLYGFLLSLA
jgi:hypothetical protein